MQLYYPTTKKGEGYGTKAKISTDVGSLVNMSWAIWFEMKTLFTPFREIIKT